VFNGVLEACILACSASDFATSFIDCFLVLAKFSIVIAVLEKFTPLKVADLKLCTMSLAYDVQAVIITKNI
jgi:hypothetical protein